MLYPARFRIIAAIAATAICLAGAQHATGQTKQPLTPEQVEKLIQQGYDAVLVDSYEKNTAGAKGASAEATGSELNQALDTTPPGLTLPGGVSATGGDTKSQQKAKVDAPPWAAIAIGICGVGLIAAAALKIRPPAPELDTAAALGAAGILCIVIAVFPALLFLLVVAALVIAIPHFLPDLHKKKVMSAFDALVDGIATRGDPVAINDVATQATDEDKKMIEARAAENGNPIAIRKM